MSMTEIYLLFQWYLEMFAANNECLAAIKYVRPEKIEPQHLVGGGRGSYFLNFAHTCNCSNYPKFGSLSRSSKNFIYIGSQ